VALSNISFDVKEGEIIYILGESGSGKSTILQLIAGLQDADSGEISVEGETIHGPSKNLVPGFDHIAYVTQDYKLQEFLTVQNNISKRISHYSESDREQRVNELLDLCNLKGKKDKFPKELSGGQQQRIALAATIADEPAIVLMDEPFSNLDFPMKAAVRQELIGMLKASNITILLVSHDPSEAMAVADRLMVLDGGKLAQIGHPTELYHHPKTPYVGRLLGPINQILHNGKETLVRPEKIRFSTSGKYQGKIIQCSFAGMHYHIQVQIKGQLSLVSLYDSQSIKVGTPVRIHIEN
jgi:iron(III) transport system ATP-binding protein